jgi:hypothetical protein
MRALLLASALLAASPVLAIDKSPSERLREELERTAESLAGNLERLLSTFEEVAREFPRYEPPQMLENGDIVIRRKPADPVEKRRRDKTI